MNDRPKPTAAKPVSRVIVGDSALPRTTMVIPPPPPPKPPKEK
jgi:hypothetical protein